MCLRLEENGKFPRFLRRVHFKNRQVKLLNKEKKNEN